MDSNFVLYVVSGIGMGACVTAKIALAAAEPIQSLTGKAVAAVIVGTLVSYAVTGVGMMLVRLTN